MELIYDLYTSGSECVETGGQRLRPKGGVMLAMLYLAIAITVPDSLQVPQV